MNGCAKENGERMSTRAPQLFIEKMVFIYRQTNEKHRLHARKQMSAWAFATNQMRIPNSSNISSDEIPMKCFPFDILLHIAHTINPV